MTKRRAQAPSEGADEDLFRPEAVTVRLLLSLPEWSQARLAAASGIDQSQISLFQRGKRVPSREVLNQLAQAADWSLSFIEPLATAVIRTRKVSSELLEPLNLGAPAAEVVRRTALRVEAAVVEIGQLLRADAERSLRAPSGEPVASDREAAEDLWSRLADLDARQRLVLVDFSPAFNLWSFAARLAEESERAAAEGVANPERRSEAVSLAQLALHVAEKCEVPPSFSACLRAYALGHLAHARRSAGEAKAAETFWQEAWKLWRDDDPHTAELLPKARLVSLEIAPLPGDWAH